MTTPGVHPTVHEPQSILITGAAGFIGSNLVHHLFATHPSLKIVALDALTYAGNLDNLQEIASNPALCYRFVHGDINDQALLQTLFASEEIDTVIHLAAESHVDRSIDDPLCFIRTNVLGTGTLLHAARQAWKEARFTGRSVRFHHVSTDEVFGSLGEHGLFTESSAYSPSSPYAASKAGSDHLVRAWGCTFGLPFTITNCSNNYGPYHFPEKLIPLMIMNALANKPLPIYGNGSNVRDWLYVIDHARAIDQVVRMGKPNETYCVGGNNECRNIDIVKLICNILDTLLPDPGGPYQRLITYVADRPGHDQRYAINASKLQDDLGWRPLETFESGLRKTIAWYLSHGEWLQRIKNKSYQGQRLGTRA